MEDAGEEVVCGVSTDFLLRGMRVGKSMHFDMDLS